MRTMTVWMAHSCTSKPETPCTSALLYWNKPENMEGGCFEEVKRPDAAPGVSPFFHSRLAPFRSTWSIRCGSKTVLPETNITCARCCRIRAVSSNCRTKVAGCTPGCSTTSQPLWELTVIDGPPTVAWRST